MVSTYHQLWSSDIKLFIPVCHQLVLSLVQKSMLCYLLWSFQSSSNKAKYVIFSDSFPCLLAKSCITKNKFILTVVELKKYCYKLISSSKGSMEIQSLTRNLRMLLATKFLNCYIPYTGVKNCIMKYAF